MKTERVRDYAAVAAFLDELRVSRRLAANTIIAYQWDLNRLLEFDRCGEDSPFATPRSHTAMHSHSRR